MLREYPSSGQPRLEDLKTPSPGFAPLAALARGRFLPGLAARLALWLSQTTGKPLRFGKLVFAVRHTDAAEALRRDLDFIIAPINQARIEAVNGPFVLGMDRSPRLSAERGALYAALKAVDLHALAEDLYVRASARRKGLTETFDAISDFARPLATETAARLFGLKPPDSALFAEVARAIFAHTFLNLGNDKAVADRALSAAPLMKQWFEDEIAARRQSGALGDDFMGALLRQGRLDDEGARRTLGGMLVGSIDTTVSAVAKILCVVLDDAALEARVRAAWKRGENIYGYCQEALRRWPHNPIVLRQAAGDTTLAGTPVRAGDRVIVWTQAAMGDPEAFPDPGRMLPERNPMAYLHLGAGLHPCAGRAVNAFQIPILVGLLLEAGIRRNGAMGWAGPFPDRLPMRVEIRQP